MQACGQQGMKEQEDCVAEEELDEITDSQVDPETEEVFVHLFKESKSLLVFFFSFRIYNEHLFNVGEKLIHLLFEV